MDAPTAVLVFLLIAQVSGGPVKRDAMDESIRLLKEKIQAALNPLNELLPNASCASINITCPLSPFRHCMENLADLTPELSLPTIGQYIQHIVQPEMEQTPPHNCTMPSFEKQLDKYVYVKCLLQLLGSWSSALGKKA